MFFGSEKCCCRCAFFSFFTVSVRLLRCFSINSNGFESRNEMPTKTKYLCNSECIPFRSVISNLPWFLNAKNPQTNRGEKTREKKVTLFGWARERTFKIPFYNLLSFYSLHFSLLFPSTFFSLLLISLRSKSSRLLWNRFFSLLTTKQQIHTHKRNFTASLTNHFTLRRWWLFR